MKLYFTLVALLAASAQCYVTDSPDFSKEPATTLPPLTPTQQQYATLLRILNRDIQINEDVVTAIRRGSQTPQQALIAMSSS